MKRLKQILNQYVNNSLVLGAEPNAQLDQLKSDLSMLSKQNKSKVVVRIIALAVIFVVWASLVWIWRNDPVKLSLIFGASGITVSWVFQKIIELLEEKKASEITLTLVINMRDEASQSVVEILSKKL